MSTDRPTDRQIEQARRVAQQHIAVTGRAIRPDDLAAKIGVTPLAARSALRIAFDWMRHN